MPPGERPCRPRLLSIAGSDPSGGAGLQADLRVFQVLGACGMGVVTAVTAQTPRAVTAVHAVPPEVVGAQIDAVAGYGVDAIKIGMLCDAPTVATVSRRLAAHWGRPPRVPVVLDPVRRATSGGELLSAAGWEALQTDLLAGVSVITPNLDELAALTGREVALETDRGAAARELAQRGPAVLAKGGHAEGEVIVDLLVSGGEMRRYEHRRLPGGGMHGSGCILSAAIAARLAAGEALGEAVGGAIAMVELAIAGAPGSRSEGSAV